MKFFVPLTLVLLLTACAAPVDKETAHQQELEKEARKNFYTLRAQLSTQVPPPPAATPAPRRGLFAFMEPRPVEADPQRKPMPTPPSKDDTVYYWQVPPPQAPNVRRYTRAELRYARALAKSPADLTPEERLWAREHY